MTAKIEYTETNHGCDCCGSYGSYSLKITNASGVVKEYFAETHFGNGNLDLLDVVETLEAVADHLGIPFTFESKDDDE